MDSSTFSIALTGVVPAACDAEAGEAERQSFPQDHVVDRPGNFLTTEDQGMRRSPLHSQAPSSLR
jgi:hypothetical protein